MTAALLSPTSPGDSIRYLRELAGMTQDEVAAAARVAPWLLAAVESGEKTMNKLWTGEVVGAIATCLTRPPEVVHVIRERDDRFAALIAPESQATLLQVAAAAGVSIFNPSAEDWFELAARCNRHPMAKHAFDGIGSLMARGARVEARTYLEPAPGCGPVFADFRPPNALWSTNTVFIGAGAAFHEVVVQLAQLLQVAPTGAITLTGYARVRFGPPPTPCLPWCTHHQRDTCNRPIDKFAPERACTFIRVSLQQQRWCGIASRAAEVRRTGPFTLLSAVERRRVDEMTEAALSLEPTAVVK